jgi:hypothetical protein
MKTLSIEGINKRAKAKFSQDPLIYAMATLISPLAKRYNDTKFCAGILIKKGDVLTSRYCGNRWCKICNRNRTGKLINNYGPVLDQMEQKIFVTLTVPNVDGSILRETIKKMIKTIKLIQDNWRKQQKPTIRGLRKLECTYNVNRNDYHPHFHFIIDNKETANNLIINWLKYYPDANIAAQDERDADNYLELFKYFTKLTSNAGKKFENGTKVIDEWHYPEALDLIFKAIDKLRIIQPMGGIKIVSEDIDELISEVMDETLNDPKKYDSMYIWGENNWFDPYTGELFSSFKPTKNLVNYRKKIRYLHKIEI